MAKRWYHREDTDYFSQPRKLFEMMDAAQRQRLFDNTARAIKGASRAVVERHIANCTSCHPDYGNGVIGAVEKFGAMPVA